MKSKLLLTAAFSAMLALVACGGGSDSSPAAPATPVYNAPALVVTNPVIGTGTEAVLGKRISVTYSGWLYDSTKADFKGKPFETATTAFVLNSGLIAGWVQGIPGMKVGGKRTLIIPASLGYGERGSPPDIPANSGLVFDIELTAVTNP